MDLNFNIDWQGIGNWLLDNSPTFEVRVVVILSLLSLVLIISGVLLVLRRKQLVKEKTEKLDKAKSKKAEKVPNWRKVLLGFDIFILTILTLAIVATALIRPFVIDVNPASSQKLDSGAPKFKVTFDMPVSQENLVFNMSPEIAGKWKPNKIWGSDWAREFTFEPEESIFPGNPVVIYITGIRTPWSAGNRHEYAIEYDAIEIPSVKEVTPATGAEKVPTDIVIKASLDGFTADFLEWTVVSVPEIGNYSIKSAGKDVYIDFDSNLNQDSEYEVTLYRAPRSYNVKTNEEMQKGDREEVGKVKFKTVTTPLLSSFAPKGDGHTVNKPIDIVFDQPMVKEDVELHFEITPSIVGSFTWKDDKTLSFKPSTAYAKDTEYKVFIKAGTKSADGGVTPSDISFSFRTIGTVKVAGTTPVNTSYAIEPSTSITIAFNQAVDKASAQSKFSISPAVTGTFTWSGNRMVFKPNARLAYNTKYSVRVASGTKTIAGLDSISDYNFSFSTKQNIVSLSIPWYKQAEGFTCNIAATRMVLAFRGIYKTESSIKSGIGFSENPNAGWVDGYGVHAGPVLSYISGYRSASLKSGMTIAELTSAVDAGYPVVGWVYNRYTTPTGAFTLPGGYTGYKGMHSEVVRGYIGDPSNPTHILVNDPWRGQLTYTVGGWNGIWAYFGNTGIVVK